jgi:hypothetical protein
MADHPADPADPQTISKPALLCPHCSGRFVAPTGSVVECPHCRRAVTTPNGAQTYDPIEEPVDWEALADGRVDTAGGSRILIIVIVAVLLILSVVVFGFYALDHLPDRAR